MPLGLSSAMLSGTVTSDVTEMPEPATSAQHATANTLLEWHANATGLIGQVSTELGRFVSQADGAKQAQLDLDAKIEKVKAQTRASLESGEGGASYRDGFADSFGGLGDEEGEKMRKSSGRMKARPGSKHGARM